MKGENREHGKKKNYIIVETAGVAARATSLSTFISK